MNEVAGINGQMSEGIVTSTQNVLEGNKAFHCREFGWQGVESCDWIGCPWADSCQALRR